MASLFRAFFFKLVKDLTFRVTLIIGVGMSVLFLLLYILIDGSGVHALATGNNMFVTSFNPSQNFGIAIPINLITFTVVEFTWGIIRNKIIAGNSKIKIYLSLFLTGLVFTLSLLFLYVGLSTLLGTIVGGFNENGFAVMGLMSTNYGTFVTPEFLWRYVICCVLVYVTITSFAILLATTFRSVGPAIPICILLPLIFGAIFPLFEDIPDVAKTLGPLLPYLNPLHAVTKPDTVRISEEYWQFKFAISDDLMIKSVCCNLAYIILFVGIGTFQFYKRDVK